MPLRCKSAHKITKLAPLLRLEYSIHKSPPKSYEIENVTMVCLNNIQRGLSADKFTKTIRKARHLKD